jgi:hypothetical protein
VSCDYELTLQGSNHRRTAYCENSEHDLPGALEICGSSPHANTLAICSPGSECHALLGPPRCKIQLCCAVWRCKHCAGKQRLVRHSTPQYGETQLTGGLLTVVYAGTNLLAAYTKHSAGNLDGLVDDLARIDLPCWVSMLERLRVALAAKTIRCVHSSSFASLCNPGSNKSLTLISEHSNISDADTPN